MYVYLLGLAVSNLCVLITAVPALFEMGGVKLPTVGEVKHLTLSWLFQNKKTNCRLFLLFLSMKISVQVGQAANMDYLKSSNMEEAKPKLAVSVAQNKSAAAIHSYSTAFYQVSHITLLLNFPTSVSQFLF